MAQFKTWMPSAASLGDKIMLLLPLKIIKLDSEANQCNNIYVYINLIL